MLGGKFKSYFSLYINQGSVSCSECFQSPLEQPWTAANVTASTPHIHPLLPLGNTWMSSYLYLTAK